MQENVNLKQNVKKVNRGTLVFLTLLVFAVSFFIGQKIIVPEFGFLNRAQVVPPTLTITNQLVTNITQSKATIFWDTNISADTQILFGPTAQSLVLQPAIDSSGVISHRYELTTLTPCTRYWFRIRSTSISGAFLTTPAYAIDTHGCQAVTTGDATPPNIVSNIQITNVTPTSVTLSWPPVSPNGGTITKYYIYGGASDIGNKGIRGNISGSQLTSPTFTINNLTPGVYTGEYGPRAGFRIQAVDSADNYSEMNAPITVTIPDPTSVIPVTMTIAQSNTWSATTLSIPFTCTVGNGTSCTGTYYKFVSVGTACPAAGSGYITGMTATTAIEGAYTLCYYSTAAGGTEVPKILTPVGVDKTKPSGQVTFPAAYSAIKGTITVTTSATDALSGVDHVDLKYDSDGILATTTQPPYSFIFDASTHTGYHRFMITVYDKAGNSTGSSSIYFDACENLLTTSSLWSVQANGTGNPVGGGRCYGNIVTQNQATTVVTTKAGLLSALSSAQPGSIVFIPGNVSINLTGEHDIAIPTGVTLASDRGYNGSIGALVYSNSWYTEGSTNPPLLKSGGDNIRITGLRIRGPSPDPRGRNYGDEGVAMMYWNLHNGTVIDNNEIYAWAKWAIYNHYIGDPGVYIHHNYFHDTINIGYGYHVWLGGQGGSVNSGQTAIVEGNYFGSSREVIDGNSASYNLIFRYNTIAEGHFYVQTNQHPGEACFAGNDWILRNNIFNSTGTTSIEKPAPRFQTSTIEVINNWFKNSFTNTSGGSEIPATFWMCNGQPSFGSQAMAADSRFQITGNQVNGQGRSLPVAQVTASALTINEGQPVTFNASTSYDPTGVKIIDFRWRFADGPGGFNDGANDQGYRQNEIWSRRSVTYTFTRPGYYDVETIAYNSYGIASEPLITHVLVRPTTGTHVLTAWLKDSFDMSSLPGRYQKQLVLFDYGPSNIIVLWSSDVNGEQGWEYARVNLDAIPGLTITPGMQKNIGYRLIATGEPAGQLGQEGEIWTWMDDFYLFGTTPSTVIQDSGLENTDGYTTPWRIYQGPLSASYTEEYSRGGKGSFRFRFGDGSAAIGDSATIYQNVTFQ